MPGQIMRPSYGALTALEEEETIFSFTSEVETLFSGRRGTGSPDTTQLPLYLRLLKLHFLKFVFLYNITKILKSKNVSRVGRDLRKIRL